MKSIRCLFGIHVPTMTFDPSDRKVVVIVSCERCGKRLCQECFETEVVWLPERRRYGFMVGISPWFESVIK